MNHTQGTFVNASGIDPNDGAKIVFVWCRDKGPEAKRLVRRMPSLVVLLASSSNN